MHFSCLYVVCTDILLKSLPISLQGTCSYKASPVSLLLCSDRGPHASLDLVAVLHTPFLFQKGRCKDQDVFRPLAQLLPAYRPPGGSALQLPLRLRPGQLVPVPHSAPLRPRPPQRLALRHGPGEHINIGHPLAALVPEADPGLAKEKLPLEAGRPVGGGVDQRREDLVGDGDAVDGDENTAGLGVDGGAGVVPVLLQRQLLESVVVEQVDDSAHGEAHRCMEVLEGVRRGDGEFEPTTAVLLNK